MDLMKALGITNTGKMNYHLKVLGNLLSKNHDGQYSLSEKGVLASRLLQEFSQTVDALRTGEEFQRDMAFQRLRLGFKLSAAVWVMLALNYLSYNVFVFLGFPLVIVYVLSINERAGGWKLLGAQQTYRALWSCAIILISFTFFLIFGYGLLGGSYLLLIPFLLWGVYTYIENHSFDDLDKKFGLGLKKARLAALIGLVVFTIAYLWELHTYSTNSYGALQNIPSSLAFILAAPFLIISCVLLMKRLKPASKPLEKQATSGALESTR